MNAGASGLPERMEPAMQAGLGLCDPTAVAPAESCTAPELCTTLSWSACAANDGCSTPILPQNWGYNGKFTASGVDVSYSMKGPGWNGVDELPAGWRIATADDMNKLMQYDALAGHDLSQSFGPTWMVGFSRGYISGYGGTAILANPIEFSGGAPGIELQYTTAATSATCISTSMPTSCAANTPCGAPQCSGLGSPTAADFNSGIVMEAGVTQNDHNWYAISSSVTGSYPGGNAYWAIVVEETIDSVCASCDDLLMPCSDACEVSAARTWTAPGVNLNSAASAIDMSNMCPAGNTCAGGDGACLAGCTSQASGVLNYCADCGLDDGSCSCDVTNSFRSVGPFFLGSTTGPCPLCNGDMDGDMNVGTRDLLLLLADYDMYDCALISDSNADCAIDTQDLLALLAEFGNDCKCSGRNGARPGRFPNQACVCRDGWQGPACTIPVTCPALVGALNPGGHVVNATIGNNYGSIASFSCEYDPVVHVTKTCQADGTWAGADATVNCCPLMGTCTADANGAPMASFEFASSASPPDFRQGLDQTFTIAPGCAQARWFVRVWGAGGGGGAWAGGGFKGGGAGYAEGFIDNVVGGEQLNIVVGAGGLNNDAWGGSTDGVYGGGGGSDGVDCCGRSALGGGYSGIFRGAADQANAIIVAGAGGGSSGFANDGAPGGGLVGGHYIGNDIWDFNQVSDGSNGGGGSQTQGGARGVQADPTSITASGPGGPLQGGDFTGNTNPGAGGGGWFGGAGGTIWTNDGSGGGGSSYLGGLIQDSTARTMEGGMDWGHNGGGGGLSQHQEGIQGPGGPYGSLDIWGRQLGTSNVAGRGGNPGQSGAPGKVMIYLIC